jgi:hypothetical protein
VIQYSPSAREPVPAELPTTCAKLEIQAGLLMPCGPAPGRMRPGQVNHLIRATARAARREHMSS